MENKSLANQTITVPKGLCKSTEEILKEFPSVERVVWIDQTNTAGEGWSGLIVEKIEEDKYNLMEFFQETNYNDGFYKEIHIQKSILEHPISKEMIDDEVETSVQFILEEYFYDKDIEDEEIPKKIVKKDNYVPLELPFND